MIEPSFGARSYTPGRISVLPPAVFVVYDEYGDNDPAKSAALGQAVTEQSVRLIAEALHRRGYDVDLSARWDGIRARDGSVLLDGQELGALASSIVQFSNSEVGGGAGPMLEPSFVDPQLAARVGWATQSDALLYVNMKGVAVSPGKRSAQVFGVVFFVVVIAAIVALMMSQKGGGNRGGSGLAGTSGAGPRAVPRSGAASSGWTGGRAAAAGAGAPTTAIAAPRGRGTLAPRAGGGRYYGGSNVHLGVGLMIPLDGPVHTHHGAVAEEDEMFAGDHVYLSLTLVSAHDGRVLWHVRHDIDTELDDPKQIDRFIDRYLATLPPALPAQPK